MKTKKRHLFDKKSEAHLLIRDLQLTGIKKHVIYIELAKKLNMSLEDCHFSKMNSRAEIETAIQALEEIWYSRRKYRHKRRRVSPKKAVRFNTVGRYKERQILPQSEMVKLTSAIGKQNERRVKYQVMSKYLPSFILNLVDKLYGK